MTSTGMIGDKDLTQVRDDGFALVPDLLSAEECAGLAARLDEYARGARPLAQGIAMQREPAVDRGEVQAAPGADVRKISRLAGDDLFWSLITNSQIVDPMKALLGPRLELFRADALMKPAGVGSAKGVHQDSPYWPIEPMALWSCWMPFDPATLENGCMLVIPGSHKRGAMPHESTQDDYVIPHDHYDPLDLIAVPMRPGSGLFFHSLLIHGTAANMSSMPRRAVTMSYMASEFRYTGSGPRPDYLRVSR